MRTKFLGVMVALSVWTLSGKDFVKADTVYLSSPDVSATYSEFYTPPCSAGPATCLIADEITVVFPAGSLLDLGSLTLYSGLHFGSAGSNEYLLIGGAYFADSIPCPGCFGGVPILGTCSLLFDPNCPSDLFQTAPPPTTTGQLIFSGGYAQLAWAVADFNPASATPLPAAFPLFATGLGALGLLGWRRKRKNAAIAAA